MQTKRDYLVSKGLAKPGHGRFSNAAKEALKDAINKGIKFDEGKEAASGVEGTADPRRDRPKGMYTFKNKTDGRVFDRLHTNACAKCSYSFQWCTCLDGPWQREYHGSTELTAYAELLSMPPQRNVVQTTPTRRRRAAKAKG